MAGIGSTGFNVFSFCFSEKEVPLRLPPLLPPPLPPLLPPSLPPPLPLLCALDLTWPQPCSFFLPPQCEKYVLLSQPHEHVQPCQPALDLPPDLPPTTSRLILTFLFRIIMSLFNTPAISSSLQKVTKPNPLNFPVPLCLEMETLASSPCGAKLLCTSSSLASTGI